MKRVFSVMGPGRFMSLDRTFHVIGQDVPCHASRDVPWNVPTSMTNRISGQNDEKVCDLRYN